MAGKTGWANPCVPYPIYHIDIAEGGVKIAHHFIQESLNADI